jgi:hypothetical protein
MKSVSLSTHVWNNLVQSFPVYCSCFPYLSPFIKFYNSPKFLILSDTFIHHIKTWKLIYFVYQIPKYAILSTSEAQEMTSRIKLRIKCFKYRKVFTTPKCTFTYCVSIQTYQRFNSDNIYIHQQIQRNLFYQHYMCIAQKQQQHNFFKFSKYLEKSDPSEAW